MQLILIYCQLTWDRLLEIMNTVNDNDVTKVSNYDSTNRLARERNFCSVTSRYV